MRYESGAAFRRALEDSLRTLSLSSTLPLVRLRKMVAFDRLLARLIAAEPDRWVLKGGLALQFRLGSRARKTKDIDLFLTAPPTTLIFIKCWCALHYATWVTGSNSTSRDPQAGSVFVFLYGVSLMGGALRLFIWTSDTEIRCSSHPKGCRGRRYWSSQRSLRLWSPVIH
jgi:Nucleotidyl transferase AbiEii toxin, Type IV TA system